MKTGVTEADFENEANFREAIRASAQRRLAERYLKGERPGTLEIRGLISEIITREHQHLSEVEAAALTLEVTDQLSGLGPIQRYLDDEKVTEIMVNGPSDIWIEVDGSLERTDVFFEDSQALRHLIERTVGPLGLRVDDSYPIADARLPDGSRFHAVLPPVARNGPVITIRKFSDHAYDLNDLVKLGTLTEEAASFLRAAVRARANLVVSGGTSSGKTSLLNALSAEIEPGERLVTVEDAAELRLRQPHVVSLEARPPSVDGAGRVVIRDLVRAALRMRPDRILVGEVRGGEALDMIQAMNTGHEGSLTTVHANSARDSVFRMEAMLLMADLGLNLDVVRSHIAISIDLVVHLSRLATGERVVWEIAEVLESSQWPPLSTLFERNCDAVRGEAPPLERIADVRAVQARCERRGHVWQWSLV